jgi:hypothetical protein
MARSVPLLLAALGACLLLALVPSSAQTPPQKLFLVNVSKGQIPPDTGQDDKTKMEIVDNFKDLGSGKALKVPFAPGDSFGSRGGGNTNWKRYALLRFDAFNPAKDPVNLELTVVHARSTSYQTRAVQLIKLKPGKNEVKIGIDELSNVNGSAPDLARVTKWYINDTASKAPTVYFGDIWLEGGEPAAPATGGGSGGGPSPLVGYHVKGKVGTLEVDLTFTPFIVGQAGGMPGTPGLKAHGDPARLARIKAAKMPKIDKPILFDTPEADAICSALEVFPPENPWNLVVEDWPLHPNSKNLIASIGADKPFRSNPDMGFILVPPDLKKVDVKLTGYAAESDKGPFPVPANTPIEGWPAGYQKKDVTLDDVQRDKLNEGGDRHASVVDPTNRMLYEFYQLKKTDKGWEAAQSSIFDLKSNKMRPEEWTSTDAAGLPIFPATVRYDEIKRGMVEHALRVTVVKTRRAFVYPARHFASPHTDEDLPRMGERIRLKKDFDVSGFSPEVQAILKGLKKYGMFVADNGIDWAISVAPDPRIKNLHEELRKIKGSDFEVVEPPAGYQPPEE